ncbi:MAG TPA: GAF domain-containing sensor histidine kinase [Candidatus Limnocylindrales bacterium]|nr:GAF domain-containing sensor histidine kinase [Candidatus Limnocylindrales bacterium]
MNPQASDRLHFEVQIAYARPVVALLAISCLWELRPVREAETALALLIAYLVAGLVVPFVERALRQYKWHLPLACDVLAVGLFLYFSPEMLPAWFLLFFVALAAGYRWRLKFALVLVFGLVLLDVALQLNRMTQTGGGRAGYYLLTNSFVALLGAGGIAFLGDRNRRFTEQQEFLSLIGGTMHVDLGLAESLRLLLEDMCAEFKTEEALLAYRDSDLERIFLWRLKSGESDRLSPENLPMTRGDGFLLDDMEASLCWNSLGGHGSGFGWDRRNGQALKILPRIPGPTQHEYQVKNFLSVAFNQGEQPVGRLFLVNRRAGQPPFSHDDLAWFEKISAHVSAALENIFLLRHLRARAIEAERSRISRDLHDGILQTLLSIEIQLDVLRRKVQTQPEQVETGLTSLQQTVRNEGGELRHLVTDLKPLRVQSADLVDLMRGFGERFRNESGLALDLLVDSVDLHAPDRVCREIFQIYREALNNIKKHAKASHVVVKLTQDDSRLALVVDDNGEGFSFAGRFTGDELDRLRLGPISIKERTRTVGGVLTVESNPGHGARLTIEVPLG